MKKKKKTKKQSVEHFVVVEDYILGEQTNLQALAYLLSRRGSQE